ncbi:MAG: hypothetical protein PT934_00015 [Peptoniphilaceae bacterium]|uniref:hypothetical protein n=1 Tax=Parvimonas sp. TaxID=1944660 RepID=UPI0025E4007D|nr:hypothetical protein [Parvimonas sp.]MCI5997064.1 hypothetical protein [Parvimonas sp.]MDD7764135.1 hypothetical protein [Peptoniphilaceae bacterium]MDY3050751.1 hypothetical protein [Parvimonas sp.]
MKITNLFIKFLKKNLLTIILVSFMYYIFEGHNIKAYIAYFVAILISFLLQEYFKSKK